jgi:hypothetical protein
MNANGNDPFGFFGRILGLPGRIQGMVLNIVVNTIDKAQTDQALREAADADRRRAEEEKRRNEQ